MLLVNEYEFMFNKNNFRKRDKENVYYWICVKKCGATFRTIIKNNEHIKDESCTLMDHSHAPNPIKNECKIIKNKIKTAALQSQDNPHKIYQEQIIGVPSVVSSQICKNASKQLIKRQRKGKLIEPSCVEHFNPPLELKKTISGQEFLIKDIYDDNNRIIIFTTFQNCLYLRESEFWLADGTYKSCPSFFKQLYTIHGSIKRGNDQICLPLVFALMTNQTENSYKLMFTALNDFAIEHRINFKDNTDLEIITDFEIAAINAINDIFPFAMHSACFFHFSQNIYRHIQKEGLTTKYMEDQNFNLLCRHLPALAFLPVSKVRIKHEF